MSYDEAVTALYQAPVSSFIAERKRLAGELRDAGDKAGATKLGKLAKPTLSAWVVNQLYWHARDAYDEMMATADRLRAGDLSASAAHREAIANLRARAARILTDGGHGAPEATLRRVATTLSAIAASGGFAPDPPGALAEDRDPVGFEVAAALAQVPVRAAPTVKPAMVDEDEEAEPEEDDKAEAEDELPAEDEAERRAELQRQLDAKREAEAKRHAEAEAKRHVEEAKREAEAKRHVEEAKREAEAKRHVEEAKREAEAKRREEAEAKRQAEAARAKKAAERSKLLAGLATARAELANRERAVTALSEQLEAAEQKVGEVRELIAMFEAKLAEHGD